MTALDPPSEAEIDLPNWLWGGNPRRLLEKADYRCRPSADGSAYLLQTGEKYRKRDAHLLRLTTIASPGVAPRWSALGRYSERADIPRYGRVEEAVEHRRVKAERSGQLIDLLNYKQLLIYDTDTSDLPLAARGFIEALNDVSFEGHSEDAPFPNAGVHVLEVDQILMHRLKFPSIWLRIEQDNRLAVGDVRHIQPLKTDDGQAFDSSSGLYSGTLLGDAYLGPLLAAGSPGVWAVNVTRTFGSLIFDFGTFISGTEGDAAELLQLIYVPGADDIVRFTRLSPPAARSALSWWSEQLNALFAVLSDLSVFTDGSGRYRPAKHLEGLLSVEQVFRRTTSMLVSHRDTHARRALLFTILDSLEGIRGVNLLSMCKLTHAKKILAQLEKKLPAPAAEVLLPAARRAVDALAKLQDGFFIRRQLRTEKVELNLSTAVI